MNINIDEVSEQVDRLLPWELTLTIGGKKYATRRPTLGMICELEAKGGTNKKNLDAVRRIFTDGKPGEQTPPDLTALGGPAVTAIVAAYLLAFNEAVAKNSNALVVEIRNRLTAGAAAGGSGTVPGTSS